MLDYKDILTKHFALSMSGAEIARVNQCSTSGVNDFLRAFKKCTNLSYPLPTGITNYAIAELVYGKMHIAGGRDESYVMPDFAVVHTQLNTRKNMTLTYQWNRYKKACEAERSKAYSYRQFCDKYSHWCEDNDEAAHNNPISGQTMEVDFAGKTFRMIDRLTGEICTIVVFVAILPYSQYIYAEGMLSTKEPQWIEVNNNALAYFGGVPAIVVCDNCKQAVIANVDWISPDLNKDYAEWAEHNHTAILPAKVRKPKYKGSVENAVGILEKGFFHDMEDKPYFSLQQFNMDLWSNLEKLNSAPFKKKPHNRRYMWEDEKKDLMPLPAFPYVYMQRAVATVNNDYHVRFDNAYYSVNKNFKHQKVTVRATTSEVKIYSSEGELIGQHKRATTKGQWCTNKDDLPTDFNGYREWNAEYFIRKAMTYGPNTVEVIKRVLNSRKLEVQTYRMCLGIIKYGNKYGKNVLEECCKQALDAGKTNYNYIKTTIQAIAEELNEMGAKIKVNEERNQGGFVMSTSKTDLNNLLSKSQKLASGKGKDGDL